MSRYEPETTGDPQISLRGVLDNADHMLSNAHELVDQLEDRILAPRPRSAGQAGPNKATEPGPHPGMRTVAQSLDVELSRLVGRMNDLLGQL